MARFSLARPFAVKPAPAFTDSFSPRPTDRLGTVTVVNELAECFTDETKNKIAHCRTVDSILERLDQTYRRPEFFIESVLESIRNFGQIADYKTELLEKYYAHLLQVLTEVQERGQFEQFNNAQNISLILKRLPNRELDKYLSRREEEDEEGGMDLLWDFVVERYRVVSRLADERRGLKESGNMGWKDKGKGGQGQSGKAKKDLLYRVDKIGRAHV